MLAFAVVGVAFYRFMVMTAAIDRACPFQTSVSTLVRWFQYPLHDFMYSEHFYDGGLGPPPHTIWGPAVDVLQAGLSPIVNILEGLRGKARDDPVLPSFILSLIIVPAGFLAISVTLLAPTILLLCLIFAWPLQETDIHDVHARSAMWMAETASARDDFVVVAQYITCITDLDAMQLIARRSGFRLLSQFTQALLEAQHGPTRESFTATIALARAMVCILLADPGHPTNDVGRACGAGLAYWEEGQRLGEVFLGEGILSSGFSLPCVLVRGQVVTTEGGE